PHLRRIGVITTYGDPTPSRGGDLVRRVVDRAGHRRPPRLRQERGVSVRGRAASAPPRHVDGGARGPELDGDAAPGAAAGSGNDRDPIAKAWHRARVAASPRDEKKCG